MPAPAAATFLLPARQRFGGQGVPADLARGLGRADPVAHDPGERAQLARHFELLPRGWPVAALTRAFDADDAPLSAWLRADPAYVRPDLAGARLLASGDALQLDATEAQALVAALRPSFGDAGMPIDAPRPARWYLRLPREAKVASMTAPADALGEDLFEHLPGGPEGRRWRALLSEAQVLLHQHPVNAARVAAGKPPVNSLWFWGGGVLPDHVTTPHAAVHSDEVTVRALAKAAGVPGFDLPPRWGGQGGLFDLRALRDLGAVGEAWLRPAFAALLAGGLASVGIDCEDGTGWRLVASQRWRFWRRPLAAFGSPARGAA